MHTGNSVRDLIPIVAVLSALFALGCLLYVERQELSMADKTARALAHLLCT